MRKIALAFAAICAAGSAAADNAQSANGLNLAQFTLFESRPYIESFVGPAKYVNVLQVPTGQKDANGAFIWDNVNEYMYAYAGADIRIVYDTNQAAISIFVGGDDSVTITNFSGWPMIRPPNVPAKWASLKYDQFVSHDCHSEAHTGASHSLLFVTCHYEQPRPGVISEPADEGCFFSVGNGLSSGTGTDNAPGWSEFDVDPLFQAGKTADEVRETTWDHIYNKTFDYFMITCDKTFIKTSW
jgi:hypothetical protein